MNTPSSFARPTAARMARMPVPLACIALCCSMGACTFPDVTYTDGGIPPCTVGLTCANKATSCGKQAQNTRTACEQQNCGGASCPMCTMPFDVEMEGCISECEACGKLEGCLNPTDDCMTLANSP